MRTSALVLLTFCIAPGGFGQHRFDPVAGSGGGVWLREGGDAWAALSAAPLLAALRGVRAGIAYFPAPWGLAPLAGSAAVIAAPLGIGGIGASLSRFGFGLYTETAFGVAYGAGAGALSGGACARYTHLTIDRYGSAGVISVDAAVVVDAGPWFRWGVRVTDVNRPALGATGERLRECASIAAMLGPPGAARLSVQAGRDELGYFSVRTALGYSGDRFAARIGTSGSFDRIHCGIAVAPGWIGLGYGVVVHPDLGWSHSIWLSIDAGS